MEPDKVRQALDWLNSQEIADRSTDKTWYGIGAAKLAEILAAYAQFAAPTPDFKSLVNTATRVLLSLAGLYATFTEDTLESAAPPAE